MQNKQWILNSFPVGEIKDNDLILIDSELNAINDGEVLIKNIYLSLDPANRGWMSGRASYVDAMKIGDIMRGGTIGIIKSLEMKNIKKGKLFNIKVVGRSTVSMKVRALDLFHRTQAWTSLRF